MQTTVLHPLDRASLEEAVRDRLFAEGLDIGNESGCYAAAEAIVLEVLAPAIEAASRPQAPASRVKRSFTAAHARALFLLSDKSTEGLTDIQLYRRYQTKVARSRWSWPYISESGLRSRRAELVAWGMVEHTGSWGTTPNNRRCRVWAASSSPAHPLLVPEPEPGLADVLRDLLAEAGVDLVLASTLARLSREVGLS